MPGKRLALSKRVTKAIERNHTPKRHWLARFKHKSLGISRSLEMVDLPMALFAKLHVNGDDGILLASLQI